MLASLRPITRLGARVRSLPLAKRCFTTSSHSLVRATQAFSTSRSAADVARMTLVGRIGADPVVRQTKNGKDFLTYRVATSDPYIKPAEGSESSLPRPPPTRAFLSLPGFPPWRGRDGRTR